MIDLRLVLSAAAACALLRAQTSLAAEAAHQAPRHPNILWIVIENIGPDLGCYGHPLVKTPHIDRFAAEGMRYRLAFSTAPMCSPSRSAFMTGMYQTAISATTIADTARRA